MRVGDGKKTVAPCGHPGEHVTANYVACLQGCDDVPRPGQLACPRCRSGAVAVMAVGVIGGVSRRWHCWTCGAVWPIEGEE